MAQLLPSVSPTVELIQRRVQQVAGARDEIVVVLD
jgi:hypothetical protein